MWETQGGGGSCCSWDRVVCLRISLSLLLFLLRFCIHFHRLTVFIITAHFAFWHFSHQFFVASFYTFGPLPLADGDGEQRRRRRRRRQREALYDSFEYRYLSLQLAVRFTNDDNRRALVRGKCGGVGAWKATDELPSPSPSLLLSQSLLCTLSCWWCVKVGAH